MKDQTYNITIESVWRSKPQALLEEIAQTWIDNNALPQGEDPLNRAKQVALLARNKDGKIVGITTVVRTPIPKLKNDLFMFRGMILPDYRIPGLFSKLSQMTLDLMEAETKGSTEKSKPIGVITEIENVRLQSLRTTKFPSGFTLIGFSQRNNPIYVYYFKGTKY